MPSAHIVVESPISTHVRIKQLSAMFDVPLAKSSRLEWDVHLDIDNKPWNVGLIVGASGSGKTTIARTLFPDDYHRPLEFTAPSVMEDFSPELSIKDICDACSAVGFNTIPAWMRPYSVLSNGERFRVDLARRLLELPDPIIVDEFSSVVDRQVAKIGSHAVQKFVRKNSRKFVALTCHYDVVDWLQPDWLYNMALNTLEWRLLRRRPDINAEIRRVPYEAWRIFAPFHYLTAELHRAARCFCLFIDGQPACFAGVLHKPHPRVRDIKGISRLVTLPDWQGLGLAFILSDLLGACYKAAGYRLHTYPAHPALIRAFDRSPLWHLEKKPATISPRNKGSKVSLHNAGDRPCAVFEYAGEANADNVLAQKLIMS